MGSLQGTLLPFLYPCLLRQTAYSTRYSALRAYHRPLSRDLCRPHASQAQRRLSSLSDTNAARRAAAHEPIPESQSTHLNPAPDDYSRTVFVDKCTISVSAGSGGNGCVAFFRDVHIPDGPPNGGDGGSGGNVWIQAVAGQTSLHKLARRGAIKAGRGIGGQGKSQGGRKGEDVCIQVPVGTVVREVWRSDPVADELARLAELRRLDVDEPGAATAAAAARDHSDLRSKWIMYAGVASSEVQDVQAAMPTPPPPRRGPLAALQPSAPITLDLDRPMEQPMLLAAGAVGGFGNPHFVTKEMPKPKFASKGELGIRLRLELELKLLADVGLVGLPNAGKSTFLRAISNSRTRVGDWAFTTLEPTIGTVVLDDHTGRPAVVSGVDGSPRTSFTIADIPGLIEDAHLDKGLGLGFLRHIERARILAFVVDLSAGDAVGALQNLWREVGEYEKIRATEVEEETQRRMVKWDTFGSNRQVGGEPLYDADGEVMSIFPPPESETRLEPLRLPPVSSKPWFVLGTKADKDAATTQSEFTKLAAYVKQVASGEAEHPSGMKNGWRSGVACVPVAAINREGIERVVRYTAGVLDGLHVR